MSMSSIAAMVMSIKNNKRTRKSTFKKLEKNGSYSKKTRLFFIKMSLRNNQEIPERYQRDIRENIIRENKKDLIGKISIFLILIVIIIYFIGFAKF